MDNLLKLSEFKSIPFCNTYSLHVLPTEGELHKLVIDINGVVHWLNRSLNIDLRNFLTEVERSLDDFSLELVVSDMSMFVENNTSLLSYLSTCWVVYDRLFAPERYFAAFFSISQNSEIKMWSKFDLKGAPTFSRLTITSPLDRNQLYWLIFSYSIGVSAFLVDHHEQKVKQIDSIGDVFPALEIGHLPGSVIRSHCWIMNSYRFSIVGYDTGYAIASVCTMESGTVIDRKTIKFSGPISVLRLINPVESELTTAVLVSSTLGPVAVWILKLEDEILSWEMSTLLVNSEIYDAVLSCTVSHDYIFIGTYGEQILVYSVADVFNPDFFEVFPMFALNIASPILSIEFVEAERLLIVLSYKGVHTFSACCSYEMLLPFAMPEASAQISPIGASPSLSLGQISHSLYSTKSPLVSPTIPITSMANWQFPISQPSNQHMKLQSHSLPQSKSAEKKARLKMPFISPQQQILNVKSSSSANPQFNTNSPGRVEESDRSEQKSIQIKSNVGEIIENVEGSCSSKRLLK